MAKHPRIFDLSRKAPATESPPARRFTDDCEIETVIGIGVEIRGDLRGKTNVELHGSIDGSCDLEGLLVVRPKGVFTGEISTTNLVAEGKIEGNIAATQKVELRPSCNVTGNIRAQSVAIAEGSYFQGEVQMVGKDSSQSNFAFQEKRNAQPPPAGTKGWKKS